MNKQVVIAGLLGAIASVEGEDPTPCADIVTKSAEEGLAAAEASLEAWEGKIEALEEAAEVDDQAMEAAQEAYTDVTSAVLPFYNAMEEAQEDWNDAVGVKQAAQDMLTAIENNAANTIEGEMMLLGEAAPTVTAALGDVEDAQDAYNDQFTAINDGTITTDADGNTESGFRAALTAEIRTESLMADAEDTAATAESTAITNYEDQEAVVNALLVIEGCAQTTYADLGWDGTEETADPENSANAEAAELTLYEDATGCCGTRMTTFLALTSGTECTTNTGWGMQGERVIRNTEETTDESTYTSTCTTTSATCDGTTDYTNYRDAKLAVMKATRMMAIVDDACTDWVTGSTDATSFTYDCSNGYLSNSQTLYANTETEYHLLRDAGDGGGSEQAAATFDPTWIYREGATIEDVVTAGIDSTYQTNYNNLYADLGTKLNAWMLAEARYWAYEAAWTTHEAIISTAQDSEAALKVTRDQKIDLLDAADAQVQAANKRVEMAQEDLDDEIAALDLLQAALVAAEEAHAVQVYLAAQADAAALVQSTIVADWSEVCGDAAESATCFNALDDLETLYDRASSNFDDIQSALSCESFTPSGGCTGFYRTALDEATTAAEMSDMVYEGAVMMVEGYAEEVAMGAIMLEMAIAECKGLGYDKAQAAKKKLMDLEADNEEAAAEVAIDYAAKASFSETGETNTLCAYPEKGSDGSQEPRPECKDGYCCGAAQKFLKDGTKLAIETCQKAEGVHTYDYYPPLPEGSPVEPTPETWRFQCISGAQKLAATAAAALAASYMMA